MARAVSTRHKTVATIAAWIGDLSFGGNHSSTQSPADFLQRGELARIDPSDPSASVNTTSGSDSDMASSSVVAAISSASIRSSP